jgi:hypothetical protein
MHCGQTLIFMLLTQHSPFEAPHLVPQETDFTVGSYARLVSSR